MLEWSVFAIAVFIGIFVVFAIIALSKAKASLERIDQTVSELQVQMEQVNKESLELLRKANGIVDQVGSITDSVQSKIKAVTPLASAVKVAKLGVEYWAMFRKKQKRKGE